MKLHFDDPNKLQGEVTEIFQEDQRLKDQLLLIWRENINFLNGQQVAIWDARVGRFRTVLLPQEGQAPKEGYIVVSNEIEPITRTMVSFITRHKPTATSYPSDRNDDFSVRRAKSAELVQKSKWEADNEYMKHVRMAYWAFTTGTVFRKDFWNPTARGQVFNRMQQQTPNQGLYQAFAQATGEQAQTEAMPAPSQHWGDTEVSVKSPFEISVDFNAIDENYDWIMEYSLQDVDWVKLNFNRRDTYYTGRVADVKPQDNYGEALKMHLDMRFQTSFNSGQTPNLKNKCVMLEFYQAPKWYMPWNIGSSVQRGATVIIASNVLLYSGPSIYDWHPYNHFIYEPYLGRFWGKSLVEQLIPLQYRLNEINASIVKNAKLMAKPKWTALEGSLIEGSISGREEDVLYFKYDPQAGLVQPQRQPGVPLPQQFFAERQMIIDTMTRIAGSNLIMQGSPPTGVSAAAALQMLLENAQSQHGTLINTWEKFIEHGQTLKLQNFQRFCKEPREDIGAYLRKMDQEIIDLDIDAICGESLEDSVNIVIEAGSSIPKSEAARQSQLMQFAQMGVWNLQDPITKQQFVSEFGITEFDQTTDAEWEKIKWENSRMLSGKPSSPSPFDKHDIHLSYHVAETQRPSFIERASPITRQLYQEHIAWHQEQASQAQAQAEQGETEKMQQVSEIDAQTEVKKSQGKAMAEAEADVYEDQMKRENEMKGLIGVADVFGPQELNPDFAPVPIERGAGNGLAGPY